MTPTSVPPPPPLAAPRAGAPGPHPSRRGSRAVWVVVGSLFTCAALVWGAVEAVGLIAHEETVESQSWTADGIASVRIDNESGEVHVRRATGSTIELTSRISRGLFDTEHTERIEGDQLVLRTDCPEIVNHFCRVDMDLAVPDGIAVDIRTRHGETTVADIDAGVTIRGEHSRAELTRLGGPLDLRMEHGSLSAVGLTSDDVIARSEHGRIDLAFAEAPTSLVVTNEFGNVDVTVPDDGTAYAISTSSDFGNVDNQLRVDPRSPSRIDVRVEFGRATLGYAG